MKGFIVTVFILSFALNAAELPQNFCYQGQCSLQQQMIWNDFQSGAPIISEQLPAFYSGECYHLSRSYNPSFMHFGGVLIEKRDHKFYLSGTFYFFAPENPYADLTLESARELFEVKYEEKKIVQLLDTFAYADLNPDAVPVMRYWMRREIGSNNMLLVAMWGVTRRVFCRLNNQ
ncbi:MAG: hypothetical protein HN353_10625 [Bdellovibrionales bacterium]|jgi:hypothetical protein|nr:hypothetical protein [Bdellovibrionales bacterium]MBT3524748.1 hypothetical protein [Bdellovibrionales bacterium]MBT7669434.1 hypothetical protein [Bdellovibrionales bacterium]